jgi:hypothetical protein
MSFAIVKDFLMGSVSSVLTLLLIWLILGDTGSDLGYLALIVRDESEEANKDLSDEAPRFFWKQTT